MKIRGICLSGFENPYTQLREMKNISRDGLTLQKLKNTTYCEIFPRIFVIGEKSCIFAVTISATPLHNAYQGGTFILYTMHTYTKQPQSIADQISTLKLRGLVFNDDSAAIQKLGVISYFRLANYWKPFESDKENHIFKPNSTFENVLSLYNFDKELRCLLFSAIQSIEIALRTKIIQIVSSSYGSFWFADASLFSDSSIHSHCLNSLNDEIKRSKEEFLVEHFKKYDTPAYPPVWKTLEVSSFGTLSKLYCNLADTKIKKRIAKDLGLPQHVYLESWIKSLSVLRNCIAHHARIWNRKYPWKPQLPKKLAYAWISDIGSQTRLYPQICCILYLLNVINPENLFKKDLMGLLNKYTTIDTSAMGFPQGWENEPLWR